MKTEFKRELADSKGISRALTRIAHEVVERNRGTEHLVLVGIHTGGVHLAQRLRRIIAEVEEVELPMGMIDITLYRDDVFIGLPQPVVGRTDLPFHVTGKRVLLVDDVLYTGRTVRAALDALVDFGRPQVIQLAVLVDRGLREFPIHADFTGLTVTTTSDDLVKVELTETGEPADRVALYRKKREEA